MKPELEKFVLTLKLSQGVDLPKVSYECGLNFAKEVLPAIRTDPEFRDALDNYRHELVYSLMDAVLVGARTGKGKVVDVAAAKEAIKLIKSALFLGEEIQGEESPLEGEAAEAAKDLLLSLASPGKASQKAQEPS